MYFCTSVPYVFFKLHVIVHLISDRGSVSHFWEEGKLGECGVQGSCAVEDCRGWGFCAMHR